MFTTRRIGVAVVLVTALLTGCGSSGPSSVPTTTPATLHAAPEPAVSPPATVAPAGRLIDVGNRPEGVAIAAGVIAVAVRSPDGVDLVDEDFAHVRFVALEGSARHLELAGPDGPLLVPDESSNRLDEVALPTGRLLASIAVGDHPHDVAAVGTGGAQTVVVGDELANTLHVIRGSRVVRVVAAPLQPGGLAATAGDVAVVGVRARLIVAYGADGDRLSSAPAGVGPTHVVAGGPGLLYVADTLGGAVLTYRLAHGTLRQIGRLVVGPRPYGMAFDRRSGRLLVTLTGSDRLVSLALPGGVPTVDGEQSWPTGRQPNSVAADPVSGLIVVTDTDEDQLQLVTP